MSQAFIEGKTITEEGNLAVVTITSMLHRCGYVVLRKGHLLESTSSGQRVFGTYGSVYQEVWEESSFYLPPKVKVEEVLDVHGGVTFEGNSLLGIQGKIFGYDCGHNSDAADMSLSKHFPGMDGFAINLISLLAEKGGTVRSLDYCLDECLSMSRQLEHLVDPNMISDKEPTVRYSRDEADRLIEEFSKHTHTGDLVCALQKYQDTGDWGSVRNHLPKKIYEAIFCRDLADLPGILSDKEVRGVCSWRLEIGK